MRFDSLSKEVTTQMNNKEKIEMKPELQNNNKSKTAADMQDKSKRSKLGLMLMREISKRKYLIFAYRTDNKYI
jgi:hypothetical protein